MKINKKLALQIKEMFDIDQDLRIQGAMNVKLTQPLITLCEENKKTKKKSKLGLGLVNFMVYMLDAVHNYRILKIIKECGYPTKKLIGKKAMFYFWVLIQHQDFDSRLQKMCLENCDFEPKEKAHLTDRILINQGKKQKFGTQFIRKENKLVPRPIIDKRNVNKRRKEYNLDTLEENIKRMNKKKKY